MNPYARVYPRDFIQTGISALDGIEALLEAWGEAEEDAEALAQRLAELE